jgi:hypothetical protein
MRHRIAFLLIMVCLAILVFGEAMLARGGNQSDKEVSGFVGFATQVTDWFKYLSAAYDNIVKKEKKRQLIIRVERIAKQLYRLETDRADFIESLLKTKGPNLSTDDKRLLMATFNSAAYEFKFRIDQIISELRKFGADLREHGVKGREVERMINFGLNYDSVIEGGSVRLMTDWSSYGLIKDVDFNENELREENKRCIKALRAAQYAASEFLEQLKK